MERTDKEIIEAMTFIKEQHNGEMHLMLFGTFECAKMMAKYLKKQTKIKKMSKTWNVNPPKLIHSTVICRMNNGYIKMCHWTGTEWLDMWNMWKPTLEGKVKEWMHIPYDKLENKEDE